MRQCGGEQEQTRAPLITRNRPVCHTANNKDDKIAPKTPIPTSFWPVC